MFKKKLSDSSQNMEEVPSAGGIVPVRQKVTLVYAQIAGVVAIILSSYHIYTSMFGFPGALKHRAAFLMMAFVVGFLTMPISKKKKGNLLSLSWSMLLALLSVVVFGYLWINYLEIYNRIGSPTDTDIALGIIATILVLLFARRKCGFPIIVLPILVLLYTFFGQYIHGAMGHNVISLRRLVNGLYLGTSGILSEPVGAAANYVVIFIVFGKFLEYTGCGQLFYQAGLRPCGAHKLRRRALTAVLASGFFGMMSGSASANVSTTGTFTIPLMKRQGYNTEFAGAVEAVASTGGQIMPPIMGASAFIIAESLQLPYLDLLKAAIWPALIYYIAVAVSVHMEAKKNGLKASMDVPPIRETLKEGWFPPDADRCADLHALRPSQQCVPQCHLRHYHSHHLQLFEQG